MDYKPLYVPKDRPVVGGYSCEFDPAVRAVCRSFAIASARRVLTREKYEPTGDVAFDLRAKAFRNVLIRGTNKAFEESHDGFKSVGLYWQGTYGDPRKTERFKSPPTNAKGNYRPSGRQLFMSHDLQDWMFKDFIYAAWTYYHKVDPYEARRRYVEVADKLLQEIPGPHKNVMNRWPAWSRENSPPPLSGDYPGSQRRPATPRPARVERPAPAPAIQGPQAPQAVEQAPAAAQGRLPAPQTPASNERTLIAPPEGAPAAGAVLDSTAPVSTASTDNAPKLTSGSEEPAGMIEESTQEQTPDTSNDGPIVEELSDGGFVIHYSEEDLVKPPEQLTIGEEDSGNMVGGIAKHLAIMGGIGAAIGGAVGLGVLAMKHFRVWPFHRPRDLPNKDRQQGEGGKVKRRRHARSWNQMDIQLTREDFD